MGMKEKEDTGLQHLFFFDCFFELCKTRNADTRKEAKQAAK